MKYWSSYPHIWYDRYIIYIIYIFIYSIFNGLVWGKINRKPWCFATKQLVILNIVPWKILGGDHSPFMHQSPCENPWVQELVGTKGHRPSYCPTLKRLKRHTSLELVPARGNQLRQWQWEIFWFWILMIISWVGHVFQTFGTHWWFANMRNLQHPATSCAMRHGIAAMAPGLLPSTSM